MATTEKGTATAILAVKATAKEIAADPETDRGSDSDINSKSVSDSDRDSNNFGNRVVATATVTETATATAAVGQCPVAKTTKSTVITTE